MKNKNFSKNGNRALRNEEIVSKIEIKLPEEYCAQIDKSTHLSLMEENALFSYLINEFFHQIEKYKILTGDCISELAFLCESYFDFIEFQEEARYTDEFESVYSTY